MPEYGGLPTETRMEEDNPAMLRLLPGESTKGMSADSSILEASSSNKAVYKSCLYSIFNRNGKHHRFLALVFMCGLPFGAYFCYENPSALQDNVIESMNITSTQFSLLYALYSWPAVVVCLLGGILIDRCFGVCYGTIIFATTVLAGHLIFSAGAFFHQFWIMALGRFLFGLGSEPLIIAQTTYASIWFMNREISMVFGILESCADGGSVINYWVMGPMYVWVSNYFTGHILLGMTLFLASSACIFSVLCSLILGAIHQRAKNVVAQVENDNSKMITFKDIKMFPKSFWLMMFIEVTYYMSVYPFFSLSKVFFMDEFGTTADEANRLSSLIYLIPFFAAPILGFIVDKVGKNIYWLLIAVTFTAASHCMLAFFSWNPYIGVAVMSLSKCILASTFYPMMVLLIPSHQLGTAYGLCWSLQNLFIGTTTMLAGVIVDHAGYIWLEVFLITSTIVSLISSVVLLMFDISHDGILNLTPAQRAARTS